MLSFPFHGAASHAPYAQNVMQLKKEDSTIDPSTRKRVNEWLDTLETQFQAPPAKRIKL